MILSHFLVPFLVSALVGAGNLRKDLNTAGIVSVFPGDPEYAAASAQHNLRFEFKPAVVTYPGTPEDVSKILKICDSLNMKPSARSGGHSYIANGSGGRDGVVVVDMKNFTTLAVNSSKGTAVIGSGNLIGDIALGLSKAGRAIPHGTCPYVGIGGHSAYGGFGFASRMWGLTLDTIKNINMVLANGTIVTVNDHHYPDLFWGMRGAGGSFGITTSIEVTTFPEPPSVTVFEYVWTLDVDGVAKGIEALEKYSQTDIPPEIDVWIAFLRAPTKGFVIFHIAGVWHGPDSKLNETIAPFLNNMPEGPDVKLTHGSYIDGLEYMAMGNGQLDVHSQPEAFDTFYSKSLMTPESSPMSLEARTAFAHYLANEGLEAEIFWFIEVELWGGRNSALNAVPADATAFAHRSSTFTIQFFGSSRQEPFPESGLLFLDNLANSIISNSPADWNYGAYPNYLDNRLPDWQKRYYGSHYPRLQALKRKYDPKNMFSFPTSIEE